MFLESIPRRSQLEQIKLQRCYRKLSFNTIMQFSAGHAQVKAMLYLHHTRSRPSKNAQTASSHTRNQNRIGNRSHWNSIEFKRSATSTYNRKARWMQLKLDTTDSEVNSRMHEASKSKE